MAQAVPRARMVAAEIEADIESEGWQVGSILGSEPQLCERYKVSRSVFREAVRLLESKRVARMKAGRGGGLLICEPDADAVVGSVALLLRRMDVDLGNLVEAHRSIAITSARLAAERIDEEGIKHLRSLLEARGPSDRLEPSEIRAEAMSFQNEIARWSRNPVLDVFSQVLVALTNQRVPLPSAESWPAVRNAHCQVIDAIIARDSALAQYRMHRHFDGIARAWRVG